MKYKEAVVRLPLIREASGESIRTPADVEKACSDLKGLAQETFNILCLNSRNKLINGHLVTVGLSDASLVHPREVFRPAISDSASAVVLVHNHPSGDPSASAEDIRITKQLIEAGRIVDIKVLDHVILGDTQLSMREEGLLKF